MTMLMSVEDETQLPLATLSDAQAAGQDGVNIETHLCKRALDLPPTLEDRSTRAEPWRLLSVQVRPPGLSFCGWPVPLSACTSTDRLLATYCDKGGDQAQAELSRCQPRAAPFWSMVSLRCTLDMLTLPTRSCDRMQLTSSFVLSQGEL